MNLGHNFFSSFSRGESQPDLNQIYSAATLFLHFGNIEYDGFKNVIEWLERLKTLEKTIQPNVVTREPIRHLAWNLFYALERLDVNPLTN